MKTTLSKLLTPLRCNRLRCNLTLIITVECFAYLANGTNVVDFRRQENGSLADAVRHQGGEVFL